MHKFPSFSKSISLCITCFISTIPNPFHLRYQKFIQILLLNFPAMFVFFWWYALVIFTLRWIRALIRSELSFNALKSVHSWCYGYEKYIICFDGWNYKIYGCTSKLGKIFINSRVYARGSFFMDDICRLHSNWVRSLGWFFFWFIDLIFSEYLSSLYACWRRDWFTHNWSKIWGNLSIKHQWVPLSVF